VKSEESNWAICVDCQGNGKKRRRLRKKVKLRYQRELELFEKANNQGTAPVRPRGHLEECLSCNGSGLLHSAIQTPVDTDNFPHLAIIGGGIGGVALAVACLHRGIPFTLYERDSGFDTRSQGYGLTLQQASRAIEGLGVFSLPQGVISTKHVVHSIDGGVLGEWGIRKWGPSDAKTAPKRTNVHITRQSLRLALLEQLGGHKAVQWAHQLVDVKESKTEGQGLDLSFQVDGKVKHAHADLVVGADGIRSATRSLLIGEDISPLRYLGCIVILGICPLADIKNLDMKKANPETLEPSLVHPLLDGATVFQTANGHERIYMMPFTADSVMWQLSFPMAEAEAKALSAKGVAALKEEASRRCQWHEPIPQILAATRDEQVSGYPVYDRELLKPELISKSAIGARVTLIGDAAHPMSPFKGQGANQALLDALALARGITHGCRPKSQWRQAGVRKSVLTEFEADMLLRVTAKVKGSAEAAQFLHSDVVLHEGNEPRGRVLLREEQHKKAQNKKHK